MLLWVFIALLTAAAIMAVLLPLGRAPAFADAAGHARRVYRDQLRELERDREEGLIRPEEAEAARAEIGRRLLAADTVDGGSAGLQAGPEQGNAQARRATALAALIGIPVLAMSLYLSLGAPQLPGAPLAGRLQQPSAGSDIETLIAQVEGRLATHPEDGRGWDVIAPVYLRLGRARDAIRAYENAIRLVGSTAMRQTGLGEAILMAEEGVVTEDARRAFEAAAALDPQAVAPRFYIGLAAEQEGDEAAAAETWRALLADAPADAAWRSPVAEALARVDPGADLVPSDEAAAIAGLPPAERTAMIESMVGGLAARLKDEPGDVEGWLRLVRSYVVLGRKADASKAAGDALDGVRDPDGREQLQALFAELGVRPAGIAVP